MNPLLKAIQELGSNATPAAIAKLLGWNYSTVKVYLLRLRRRGLVTSNNGVYSLTERGMITSAKRVTKAERVTGKAPRLQGNTPGGALRASDIYSDREAVTVACNCNRVTASERGESGDVKVQSQVIEHRPSGEELPSPLKQQLAEINKRLMVRAVEALTPQNSLLSSLTTVIMELRRTIEKSIEATNEALRSLTTPREPSPLEQAVAMLVAVKLLGLENHQQNRNSNEDVDNFLARYKRWREQQKVRERQLETLMAEMNAVLSRVFSKTY